MFFWCVGLVFLALFWAFFWPCFWSFAVGPSHDGLLGWLAACSNAICATRHEAYYAQSAAGQIFETIFVLGG